MCVAEFGLLLYAVHVSTIRPVGCSERRTHRNRAPSWQPRDQRTWRRTLCRGAQPKGLQDSKSHPSPRLRPPSLPVQRDANSGSCDFAVESGSSGTKMQAFLEGSPPYSLKLRSSSCRMSYSDPCLPGGQDVRAYALESSSIWYHCTYVMPCEIFGSRAEIASIYLGQVHGAVVPFYAVKRFGFIDLLENAT